MNKEKRKIRKMFNSIAKNYDLLNHILTFGLDYYWRKKAIQEFQNNPKEILDIATGTGDFAISAYYNLENVKITGIDISEEMLKKGEKKIIKKKLDHIINLEIGDAESLSFNDNTFDGITVGFGVRNFENLDKGLSELYRTLKKGGKIVILEPSNPGYFPMKQIHYFYFNYITPLIGKLISGDNQAYSYLSKSVNNFPKGKLFLNHMKNKGFLELEHKKLSFGVVDMYTAIK